MVQRIPMTIHGELSLQTELKDLKTSQRPQVISAIAEARDHGDLKENAEYHAARERQSFIEGRIKELESKLSNAHVINVKTMVNRGKVIFGATVKLHTVQKKEEITYKIVGEDEADIQKHKISFISPLARALISKKEGEEVTVKTPKGNVDYEIIKVYYA